MTPSDLRSWNGNMAELAAKAVELLRDIGYSDASEPSLRLIRDYMQRGILGQVAKNGREVVFSSNNLIRFLAARVLLDDGWPLPKIKQHFDVSAEAEIEVLIPSAVLGGPHQVSVETTERKTHFSVDPGEDQKVWPLSSEGPPMHDQVEPLAHAMSAIERIRNRTNKSAKGPPTKSGIPPAFSERTARISSVKSEMRDALGRLGLPLDSPPTEELTLIAIATWCQVLIQTDKLAGLTIGDAEELGRVLTASLIHIKQQKDLRK